MKTGLETSRVGWLDLAIPAGRLMVNIQAVFKLMSWRSDPRVTLKAKDRSMYVMEASLASTAGSVQSKILEQARIVSTPGTCGGKPRIDGHRIKVEHIAVMYERMGMSPDEIVTELPTITLAQVHAALAYYYDHRQEIDADIEEGKRFVEELKAKSPPSKLQKLLDEARKANGSDDLLPPG